MSPAFTLWLLVVQVCVTWLMLGLIWFVQIVHYPLFRDVGEEYFEKYEERHAQRTGFLVAIPMIIELILAVFLAWKVGGVYAWSSLGILIAIWSGTAVWQVPQHGALARGFDEIVWRKLVRTNWLRTLGWTMRGIIVAAWLVKWFVELNQL